MNNERGAVFMPKGIPKRKYTGEFKQMVVEDIVNNKISYHEAARKYELSNHHMPKGWERIYLEEGVQALYVERRGRACSANGVKKGRPLKLEKEVEEDLIAEVQRLRMEIDYLKKLNALVRAEKQQKSKKLR